MKCPHCGAETKLNPCEYCGSQLPQEQPTVIIQNHYYGTAPQGAQNTQPRATQTAPKKKSNTWLWVLGWIFLFPLPLTILLLRNKTMKAGLKYTLIVLAWLLFFVIGLTAEPEQDPQETEPSSYTEIQAYTPER